MLWREIFYSMSGGQKELLNCLKKQEISHQVGRFGSSALCHCVLYRKLPYINYTTVLIYKKPLTLILYHCVLYTFLVLVVSIFKFLVTRSFIQVPTCLNYMYCIYSQWFFIARQVTLHLPIDLDSTTPRKYYQDL